MRERGVFVRRVGPLRCFMLEILRAAAALPIVQAGAMNRERAFIEALICC